MRDTLQAFKNSKTVVKTDTKKEIETEKNKENQTDKERKRDSTSNGKWKLIKHPDKSYSFENLK